MKLPAAYSTEVAIRLRSPEAAGYSAKENQRFVEPFSLLGTYSFPIASLTYIFAGSTFTVRGGR